MFNVSVSNQEVPGVSHAKHHPFVLIYLQKNVSVKQTFYPFLKHIPDTETLIYCALLRTKGKKKKTHTQCLGWFSDEGAGDWHTRSAVYSTLALKEAHTYCKTHRDRMICVYVEHERKKLLLACD